MCCATGPERSCRHWRDKTAAKKRGYRNCGGQSAVERMTGEWLMAHQSPVTLAPRSVAVARHRLGDIRVRRQLSDRELDTGGR